MPYSKAEWQGCQFFRKSQKKTEKEQKCTEIYKKRDFFTIFEKGALMRATITCMEGTIVYPGGALQSWRTYMGQTLVFVANSAMWESFLFFSGFLLLSRAFWVLPEGRAIGYNSTEF